MNRFADTLLRWVPLPERAAAALRRLLENRRMQELALYVVVSGFTAAVDFAMFSAMVFSGVAASAVAGAASYLLAMVLHYNLAVRYVFRRELTGKSGGRLLGEYLASGFIGVSLTVATIHVVSDVAGFSPYLGKLVGIGVSFFAVYSLRTFVVFKPKAATANKQLLDAATTGGRS